MSKATVAARIAALAVSGLLLLSGCAGMGGSDAATSGSKASSDATIVVNNVEPTAALVPSNTNDLAGWKIVTELFDGLVTFSDTGKLIYDNATSITANRDSSVYTIRIKPGLTFSNGEKITARTYSRTWSFAANAANGQMGASIFATIKGFNELQNPKGDGNAQLAGLDPVDASTLKVTLAAPDSSFPYKVGDVAFLPLPSEAFDDIGAFGKHPIGNGPYAFKSWTPNQSIVLKKNNKYVGPRAAHNAGIEFRFYQDLNAAYADAQSGQLDVLDSVPVSALGTFRNDDSLQPFSKPGPGFKSLVIPESLAHFSGQEGVLRRQAISLAIDRSEIAQKVFKGSVTPATDFTAPPIAGYSKDLDADGVLDFDASRAKRLWGQANAISPWSGTFRIAYASDGADKDWVDATVNSVRNTLGISAESLIFPTSSEFSTAVNKRTVKAAFSGGLQSDYPHPEGYLVQGYASWSADGKGLNNGDYKSGEFDALIRQAAKVSDLSASIGYYRRAQQVLLGDLPVVPLWYKNVSAVAAQGVDNVTFNYMGFPVYGDITK